MKADTHYLLSDLIGMNKVVFRIPVYQRNYDWSEANCIRLMEDVKNILETGEKHFLGTLGVVTFIQCSSIDSVCLLHSVWNALSPDPCLTLYIADYRWLTKVYQSVKPLNHSGELLWAALGSKTMELIHQNIEVGEPDDELNEIITLDAEMIEAFIKSQKDPKKTAKKMAILRINVGNAYHASDSKMP